MRQLKPQILRPIAFAILLLAAASAASAATYYTVLPLKREAGLEAPPGASIAVSLAATTLPAAKVGEVYSYDLAPLLVVTGDPQLDAAQAIFSAVSGLPPGIALGPAGMLSGTPTAAGSTLLRIRATYKTKAGEQAYEFVGPWRPLPGLCGVQSQAGGYFGRCPHRSHRSWADNGLAERCGRAGQHAACARTESLL